MRTKATLWLSLVVCLPVVVLAQAKDADALGRQLVAAIVAKDKAALTAASIDEAEFKRYIWPTLGSRVAGDMTPQKFYGMYKQSSAAGVEQHLTQYGGHMLEFVSINPGQPEKRGDYRLYRNPEITVRDGGKESTLRLGSALVEHDGVFKVANYYRAPDSGAKP